MQNYTQFTRTSPADLQLSGQSQNCGGWMLLETLFTLGVASILVGTFISGVLLERAHFQRIYRQYHLHDQSKTQALQDLNLNQCKELQSWGSARAVSCASHQGNAQQAFALLLEGIK